MAQPRAVRGEALERRRHLVGPATARRGRSHAESGEHRRGRGACRCGRSRPGLASTTRTCQAVQTASSFAVEHLEAHVGTLERRTHPEPVELVGEQRLDVLTTCRGQRPPGERAVVATGPPLERRRGPARRSQRRSAPRHVVPRSGRRPRPRAAVRAAPGASRDAAIAGRHYRSRRGARPDAARSRRAFRRCAVRSR